MSYAKYAKMLDTTTMTCSWNLPMKKFTLPGKPRILAASSAHKRSRSTTSD